MTTESDNAVNSEQILIFFHSILFFRYAMQIARTHITYLKNNIEHRKLKPTWNSTLSLSVVIIRVEIFYKFHDNDTVNSHYDDKTQYYYSWELLNSFFSNFDCFSTSLLTRWNYSLLFQADCWSSWLRLYRPRQWQSSLWHLKFSKCTVPFHIIYELGQMTEIPLGTHPGLEWFA